MDQAMWSVALGGRPRPPPAAPAAPEAGGVFTVRSEVTLMFSGYAATVARKDRLASMLPRYAVVGDISVGGARKSDVTSMTADESGPQLSTLKALTIGA